jgi:metal-responsive CopG/Arc/MetJ family transcriptional regulator
MQSLTISLPDDVQLALDEYVRKEGVSRDDVVIRAVEEHLCRQGLRSSQQDSSAALEAGYREMAADEAHELEAHEWAEATVGDAYDAAR